MGNFANFINSSAGGAVVGTGLGLLLQGHNDRRQLEQQKKLSQQQLGFDLQKMGAEKAAQLQMWKDTSYPAQKEMMEKAGLNPALMYGMGGGGGVTTGSGSSGVGGASAPAGGGEIMGMAMMKAQLDLVKAQAKKTETEAENIGEGGVERRKGEMQILDLATGVENKAAQTKLIKVQTNLSKLEERIKTETFDDVIDLMHYNAENAFETLRHSYYENEITKETFNSKVAMVEAQLINIGIDTALKKSGIDVNSQNITESKNKISQGWKSLSQTDKRILLEAMNTESNRMNANTNQKNADTNVREFFEKMRNNDMIYESGKQGRELQKFLGEMMNDTEIMKMSVGSLMGILNATRPRGRY